MATRKYVRQSDPLHTVPLRNDRDETLIRLLWGDPVLVEREEGERVRVSARGVEGWVQRVDLGDEGLLELYVIDVGQGDGVLMRTPDDKWHLIDGGVSNARQMTKKGAANFLRWKFQEDLKRDGVELEDIILTHPDFDHYGGLCDVLRGDLNDGRTFPVSVQTFYHSGMGRFADAPKLGATVRAEVAPPPFDEYRVPLDDEFITELLDDRDSFANPVRRFERSFAELAELVGRVPRSVRRLSRADRFLPGYGPGASSGAVISVLGPVAELVEENTPGLRLMSSESVTRNGHSVVLRVDYGRARFLLTGDLNSESQRLLLSYQDRLEFASDVAKGCHHGSDDIDLRFVRAVNARATVISSGDSESYAHPRPRVLGASARYGREAKGLQGATLPPLLYSTELARSVALGFAASVEVGGESTGPGAVRVRLEGRQEPLRALTSTPIVSDLVYGLVNVRTDGQTVLIGTRRESGKDFELQAFKAGVDP
jgi:beta-lactamase superfamily II metal-dependent hydrolase